MPPDVILDERRRHLVAETWAFRQRTEREAATRFARLAGQLREQGAGAAVLELADKAVVDEQRHVGLCGEVAVAYGRADCRAAPEAHEVGPVRATPRDRLLYEVVGFCCVVESINAALLTMTYELATAPRIRDVTRAILEDEVDHARLGWAHLAAERAQGRGDFLSALLPGMLRATVDDDLVGKGGEGADSDAALEAHGNLSLATKRELFAASLRDVIFPGFDALGLNTDAARRWWEQASRTGQR